MSGGDWKDMFHAACRGDLELVRFHLEHGVDPDHAHPEYQETPLVAAILAKQPGAADLLLDHGADPTLVSPMDQFTPLQAARLARLTAIQQRLEATGATA